MSRRIRLGISSCLLGEAVRYNGGHKRDAFLVDVLGRHVEWVAVCPEVELGMGTPRPPIRLERRGEEVRLIMPSTGGDYSDAMRLYAERRVEALAHLDLDGYVLKRDSPSCGLRRVLVYDETGAAGRSGQGLFAEILTSRLPELPVAEEDWFRDPRSLERFLTAVLVHYCWRKALDPNGTGSCNLTPLDRRAGR